jgi:amino acid transporter
MTASTTPTRDEHGRLASAKLGTIDCVAQSLSVGPITSAALLGGIVAAYGGSSGPIFLIVATLGVFCLGGVLVMFARKYIGAGAIYDYVAQTFGATTGIATAGFYYLAYIILGGPAMLIGGGVLGSQMLSAHFDIEVKWWLFSLGLLLVCVLLNVRGVEISVKTQLVIFALSVTPYVITALVVIAKGGLEGNSLVPFNPNSATSGDFMRSFMFAVLLFVGVESCASLGEETRDPRRSIPRATMATIAIVGGFCLLMTYAGTIGFGVENVSQAWASDPLGLSTIGSQYVGEWMATLMEIGLVLDMLAVGIGFTLSSSRGLFALSRGHLLPQAFTRTSRWGTPVVGIAAFAAVSVFAIILDGNINWGVDSAGPYTGFFVAATLGGLLVMTTYLILSLAALKVVATGGWASYGWLVGLVSTVTVGLGIYGSIRPLPTDQTRYGVYIAGALILVCIAWGVYHGVVRHEKVVGAAVNADVAGEHPEGSTIGSLLEVEAREGEPTG